MESRLTREILVVDDEEGIAQILELTLRDLGYDVAVASSGTEAVQKAAETNPDLVLLDIKLGGDMSGIEAANEIRSRLDIPVVYFTGRADEDELSWAKMTEPFGYLLKSFEKRQLYMTIEGVLYKHSTEKAAKENLDQLSKKNRYEAIVRTVAQSVRKSINLEDVLENAVESISQNIDSVDSVSIFLVEGQEAVLEAYRGFPDWFVKRLARIPYPKGATWKTIMEGESLYCADVDQDTAIGSAGREVGIKSYLIAPIRYEGMTVGTLNINSLNKNAFDEEELKLLEIVAQQVEMAVNNAKHAEALRQSEESLRLLVEGVKDYAIFMLDPQGYIVSWNVGAERIKGYKAGEIIGKHFSIFYPKEDIERGKPEFELKVVAAEGRFEDEDWRIRKDGSPFWANVVITAVRDENGNLHGFSKVTRDLTDRKRAEEVLRRAKEELETRVEERTNELAKINEELKNEIAERMQVEEQLKESLREKEVLLKEIHHRVKNNLQIVSSLLSLQSRSITGKAREKLKESQSRVKSMALIHEKLYQSEDLQGVDFKEYIKGLLDHLLSSYGVRSSIELNLDIDDVSMNIDKAVPCGLIVNELVSNTLKYAFPGEKKGEIRVTLKLDRGSYRMIVGNDGDPFPENVDFRNTKSLGLQLVCALTDQLGGTIELDRGSGTEFRITFPAS